MLIWSPMSSFPMKSINNEMQQYITRCGVHVPSGMQLPEQVTHSIIANTEKDVVNKETIVQSRDGM